MVKNEIHELKIEVKSKEVDVRFIPREWGVEVLSVNGLADCYLSQRYIDAVRYTIEELITNEVAHGS